MAIRKAFIFRGGDKLIEADKPLQYLDNSTSHIAETLKKYGKWDTEIFDLDSVDMRQILDNLDKKITEIVVFYIGHGKYNSKSKTYYLIGDNLKEISLSNIINPIHEQDYLTNFAIIIDAGHSNEALAEIPKEDNIEIVFSVSYGKAYENDSFQKTRFTHHFGETIINSDSDKGQTINLEYICDKMHKNPNVTEKPTRIPPLHTKFTNYISIAQSTSINKNKLNAKIPLEFLTGQVPIKSMYYIARIDRKTYDILRSDSCFIRIQAPSQYGKSSLLLRFIKEAENQKYQVVF